jgi:radical SAM protein with 4Fe4S-binding SPASM domain
MKNINHIIKLFRTYLNYKVHTKYPPFPIRLWVEPTDFCNLRCNLCLNKNIPNNKKGYMDFKLFEKLIEEVKEFVYDINLFHRGEPLLHPEIFRMIEISKNKDIFTRIHTNATLLSNDKIEQIFSSGLDFISFSFDGYDKEGYEKKRVNATYEVTLSNIIEFLKMKRKKGVRHPFTVLQIIEEEGEKVDKKKKNGFLKKFKDLPVNRIVIRHPHNWGGNLDELDLKYDKKRYICCTFPWYSLTILWDGKVVPCPQDFKGVLNLGNLNNLGIKEIWNGDKLVSLRERFSKRSIEDIIPCNKCDRIWRKTILGIPTDYLSQFLSDNIFAYRRKG